MLAFCEANRAEVDAYVEECRAEIEKQAAAAPQGPDRGDFVPPLGRPRFGCLTMNPLGFLFDENLSTWPTIWRRGVIPRVCFDRALRRTGRGGVLLDPRRLCQRLVGMAGPGPAYIPIP